MGKRLKSIIKEQQKYYYARAGAVPFYYQALELRYLFVRLGLDVAETNQWRIINDFIRFAQAGCVSKGQLAKIQDFVIRYGPQSLFYHYHTKTKRERVRYTQRIFYICRQIRKIESWKGFTKHQKRLLTLFLREAIEWVRWLMVRPLTEKQKRRVYEVEHLLGIWWDDISPEDNGMVLKEGGNLDE